MAMMKKIVLFLIVLVSLSSFYSVAYGAEPQKIGVLVMGSGMNETYKPDWIMGYMEHFFPIYTPGLMAGGDLEGGSCLSLIHYANRCKRLQCAARCAVHKYSREPPLTYSAMSIRTPAAIRCIRFSSTPCLAKAAFCKLLCWPAALFYRSGTQHHRP